ncbi:MAG: VWA domain-containing protein [Alphaproteobacteria bacterium]
MKLIEALDLEERVGRFWHRLVGEKATWPTHPEAEVRLDEVRASLAVFFRGVGGDRGIQIVTAGARASGHRLTWKQRIGMDEERLMLARRDSMSLALPGSIAVFAEYGLNRDLYGWLAAFLAVHEPPAQRETDPLRADLATLMHVHRTTRTVLNSFPGLAGRHRRLAAALAATRPRRRLTGVEADVEAMVMDLLGVPAADSNPFRAAVLEGRRTGATAPRSYRPFLPVPLWGETLLDTPGQTSPDDAEPEPGMGGGEQDETRRHAERRRTDNANRDDPLLLNRFEKILAIADMVNLNRAPEDTDEEEARKAADDLDTFSLAQHSRKAATKLKFDLDLPPSATDTTRLTGTSLLPEWDYRIQAHHPDHCSVLLGVMTEEGEGWEPDETARRHIRSVRRRFEALRARRVVLRAQEDGSDLDTDAVVRAHCDLLASGIGSDRVWMQHRAQERDLCVAVLVDVSLSTDAWVENRRVLDVEKEALMVFSHGLAACGDPFAIMTFTSRRRSWVRIDTIKDFDEPFGEPVMRRIGAIRPGYYTRIGAAIRHATSCLETRPNRHRLLLVLTDGKPNDIDHYEGRYGVEDTRQAVIEARARGLAVFGVTIDQKAQTYFPHMFGRGHYAIVHSISHLSTALQNIYRHLAGAASK